VHLDSKRADSLETSSLDPLNHCQEDEHEEAFNNHTTVVLLLSDGTHRFSSGTYEMTNQAVWRFVRETMKNVSDSSSTSMRCILRVACSHCATRGTKFIELAEKYS
jgi:hypothetical protein